MITKFSLVGVMTLLLTACPLNAPKPGDKAFAPTYPIQPDKGKSSRNGAIYSSQTSMSLYETPIARRVGDILTVMLIEKTNAMKEAQSNSLKDNATAITNPNLFGAPVSIGGGVNLGFANVAKRNFQADSESRQNNQLTGSISVTVKDVLANGNLVVQGEKWIEINTGNEYVRLSGIVRILDIQPDNTVTSDRVANARIAYSGTGQNHEDQKMGWISRFLWSSLFPF